MWKRRTPPGDPRPIARSVPSAGTATGTPAALPGCWRRLPSSRLAGTAFVLRQLRDGYLGFALVWPEPPGIGPDPNGANSSRFPFGSITWDCHSEFAQCCFFGRPFRRTTSGASALGLVVSEQVFGRCFTTRGSMGPDRLPTRRPAMSISRPQEPRGSGLVCCTTKYKTPFSFVSRFLGDPRVTTPLSTIGCPPSHRCRPLSPPVSAGGHGL